MQARLSGQFDLIILSDVLEHLVDPWGLLSDLKSLLNSGGHVLAAIPNVAFLPIRIKLFAGIFGYTNAGGIMDINHLRWFTYRSASRMFMRAGYSVTSSIGGAFGIRGRKIRKIPFIGDLILKASWVCCAVLAHLLPGLFAYHIVVAGVPSEMVLRNSCYVKTKAK